MTIIIKFSTGKTIELTSQEFEELYNEKHSFGKREEPRWMPCKHPTEGSPGHWWYPPIQPITCSTGKYTLMT